MREKSHQFSKTTGWLRAELAHHGKPYFTEKKNAFGGAVRVMLSDSKMEAALVALGYSFGGEDDAGAANTR